MTVELTDTVITQSGRNIDKTKVYSRQKKQACSRSIIPLFARPTVRSLCDTTSHHRLITSIHKKQLEYYKYMLRTRPTSPKP